MTARIPPFAAAEPPPVEEPAPWLVVKSRWIAAVRYQSPVLFIQSKDGRLIVCPDVAPDVWEAFIEAPSLGKFFNRHLRRPARPRVRRPRRRHRSRGHSQLPTPDF